MMVLMLRGVKGKYQCVQLCRVRARAAHTYMYVSTCNHYAGMTTIAVKLLAMAGNYWHFGDKSPAINCPSLLYIHTISLLLLSIQSSMRYKYTVISTYLLIRPSTIHQFISISLSLLPPSSCPLAFLLHFSPRSISTLPPHLHQSHQSPHTSITLSAFPLPKSSYLGAFLGVKPLGTSTSRYPRAPPYHRPPPTFHLLPFNRR